MADKDKDEKRAKGIGIRMTESLYEYIGHNVGGILAGTAIGTYAQMGRNYVEKLTGRDLTGVIEALAIFAPAILGKLNIGEGVEGALYNFFEQAKNRQGEIPNDPKQQSGWFRKLLEETFKNVKWNKGGSAQQAVSFFGVWSQFKKDLDKDDRDKTQARLDADLTALKADADWTKIQEALTKPNPSLSVDVISGIYLSVADDLVRQDLLKKLLLGAAQSEIAKDIQDIETMLLHKGKEILKPGSPTRARFMRDANAAAQGNHDLNELARGTLQIRDKTTHAMRPITDADIDEILLEEQTRFDRFNRNKKP